MPMEVALLQWGDEHGGVRLLGRSGDPEMVSAVRRHLVGRLDEPDPAVAQSAPFRLVQPSDEREGGRD